MLESINYRNEDGGEIAHTTHNSNVYLSIKAIKDTCLSDDSLESLEKLRLEHLQHSRWNIKSYFFLSPAAWLAYTTLNGKTEA